MRESTVKAVLMKLCKLLYEEKYEVIALDDLDDRVSASELEKAIDDYGGKLTLPPEDAYESFEDYYEDGDTEAIVEFDLWFDDERSDLTLRTEVDNGGGYSIVDVRVL